MADQMAKELTDDTTVIEAPSFIVPYIYEKTPLTDKNSNDVSGKNKPASLQSPEVTRIISSNFAGSTLFKLTAGLGEDLVQEFVHRDMIYKEQRRPKIDRNEANITALKENLLLIQKTTEDFRLHLVHLKFCPECPFQTESTLTLEHHMEKIHRILDHETHQDLLNLKNLDFYRCNICYYQTKNPSEMMKHIQEEMAKLGGKSQTGSSLFTAPQFLFDDRLKGTPNEKQIRNLTVSLMKEPLYIDDRLPPGWYRKVFERKCGKTAGTYYVIIYSPKHRRFRSRNEVKKYFDEIGECILKVEQFDFSVSGKNLV